MKYKRGAICILIMMCVSFLADLIAFADVAEPQRPDVNLVFDADKESKINRVASLPLEEAVKQLKGPDFAVDDDMLHKAVFQSFRHRKKEAIALALNYVSAPVVKINGDKILSRGNDFYIARKILQVFPDEAVGELIKLYRAGETATKGNVIRVVGNIAGGPDLQDLLIDALEDKNVCGEENPEVDGDPLRICDEAYNQLVLRYKVKNVLRTIGPGHRIEVRDYHINILKDKLKDLL
jgi:hypothetical protein